MIVKANYHTHTTFCDGKHSARDMVISAIEKGFTTLGFSGHSYTNFDLLYCMSEDGTKEYIKTLTELKSEYKDKIEILIGTEQDFYSGVPFYPFDYVIGSVHYIRYGDKYLTVDESPASQKSDINTYFAGDPYAFVEAYYENVSKVYEHTRCDIIGHFDLVAKFNKEHRIFDTSHTRYENSAFNAINSLVSAKKPFEVNTGGMYRYLTDQPYPAPNLLEMILHKGGEVILSSDSHDKDSIGYKFDEMITLLKNIGYKYSLILTGGEFKKIYF